LSQSTPQGGGPQGTPSVASATCNRESRWILLRVGGRFRRSRWRRCFLLFGGTVAARRAAAAVAWLPAGRLRQHLTRRRIRRELLRQSSHRDRPCVGAVHPDDGQGQRALARRRAWHSMRPPLLCWSDGPIKVAQAQFTDSSREPSGAPTRSPDVGTVEDRRAQRVGRPARLRHATARACRTRSACPTRAC
jgi:hypothetical protein